MQNGTLEDEPLPVSSCAQAWGQGELSWLGGTAVTALVRVISSGVTVTSLLFQPMSSYRLLAENPYIKMVSLGCLFQVLSPCDP